MELRLPQASALMAACLLAGAIGGFSAFLLQASNGSPFLLGGAAQTVPPASATLPKGATLIAQNRTWPITHTGTYHINLPLSKAAQHAHGFSIGFTIDGTASVGHSQLLPTGTLVFNVRSYEPGAKFHLLMADAHS